MHDRFWKKKEKYLKISNSYLDINTLHKPVKCDNVEFIFGTRTGFWLNILNVSKVNSVNKNLTIDKSILLTTCAKNSTCIFRDQSDWLVSNIL